MAESKVAISNKGSDAEEVLRDYFLSVGYFVVRGLKFRFQGDDVTDVDLWLYHRHSPVSRERINVDVKNKKSPQAIERILWARGLQITLGLDNCIVATTDRRPNVVDFGKKHGAIVLDAPFFSGLRARGKSLDRISDDEFFEKLGHDGLGKLGGNWRQRVENAKSAVLTHLGYDACNGWLVDLAFFTEQALVHTQRSEAAIRVTYLLASFFLVGLDFAVAPIAFEPQEARVAAVEEGLRHGSDGRKRTEGILKYASQIAVHYLGKELREADRIQSEIRKMNDDTPVAGLAEFFGKSTNLSNVFRLAKELESLAYQRQLCWPASLNGEIKSVIAVLLDFLSVQRATFFSLCDTSVKGTFT